MNHKILIVDDEEANLRLLERLFRLEYKVVTATSGSDALELLKTHDFALIISDQRMPGMTGIEFLKRAAEMRQHTVRIILTGYTDVTALVEVINSGVVYKYVAKPWVNEDLQQTVVRAIERYETIKHQYALTIQNERLLENADRMERLYIRLISEMLDLKDSFLHQHSQRVSGYATAIGFRLKLDGAELEQLALAAFLHDVGKIGISDNFSHKISPLTDEDCQKSKISVERGVQMLASIPERSDIAAAVRYATEHFDGTGFPENLAAEQIPLFSRIIAVANEYDEMTKPRFADEALMHDEAIKELQSGIGEKFDSSVVEEFCNIESIDKICRTIADGIIGIRLPTSLVPCDEKSLSTGEVLQKFKTEPLLALDILKMGNLAGDGEATAQLLPLMAKIGEAKLRSLLDQNGLPAPDEFTKTRTRHALRHAFAAQLLAAHTRLLHPDDAYTLGLLYNVGEALLFNMFPREMLELMNFDVDVRSQRQIGIFGIDAAQISRLMLEACGVPAALTMAIENQQEFMHINHPTALIMQIACKIAYTKSSNHIAAMNTVENSVLETLSLSRADLNKIYDRANFISEEHTEAPEQPRELGGDISL